MMASRATPPTTPPAMAPALLPLEEEEELVVEEEEADGVLEGEEEVVELLEVAVVQIVSVRNRQILVLGMCRIWRWFLT